MDGRGTTGHIFKALLAWTNGQQFSQINKIFQLLCIISFCAP